MHYYFIELVSANPDFLDLTAKRVLESPYSVVIFHTLYCGFDSNDINVVSLLLTSIDYDWSIFSLRENKENLDCPIA